MKKLMNLGLCLVSLSMSSAFAQKLPVIKSVLNLTGKVSPELKVSIEVYAVSTNRTRPELTMDGWEQVPLISDKTEELKLNTNTYSKKLVSNWTTVFGVNYQAKLYRFHFEMPGYAQDGIEIYVSKNCGSTLGFEAGNTIVVTPKDSSGSKFLSAKVVNRLTDSTGARELCISPRENETLNEQLDIILK
jgi:hypothetical protein